MSLRFHEIAEANHRILNPFSTEKLDLLGTMLNFDKSARVLDLACGKGEMLARWAQAYGIRGVGVDISEVFIQAAQTRAYMMDVGDKLNFVVSDAAEYPEPHHEFDVVACIGATWIGGGLAGTLDLMRKALKPGGGLLIVGEVYWHQTPSSEVAALLDIEPDTFATLGGTLDRFKAQEMELVEMILADHNDFDRYESSQWMSVHQYLKDNRTDPEAHALRQWIDKNRTTYLHHGRQVMGWGVFVLHVPPTAVDFSATVPIEAMNPNTPISFEVTAEMLWVRLADGRVIGNPIGWYEWLANAPAHLQEQAELDPIGIAWPSLEGQIRIRDMLEGRR